MKSYFKLIYKLIIFLAAVAGIIALLDRVIETETERRNYAVDHQPQLHVISPVTIEKYDIEYSFDDLYSNLDTLKVNCAVTIYFEITTVNKGNVNAFFKGYALTDKIENSVILRKILTDKQYRKNKKVDFDELNTRYENVQVTPGDNYKLSIQYKIAKVDTVGDTFLHLLLLYENELGHLFDTYIWFELHTNPLLGVEIPGIPIFIASKYSVKDLQEFVSFKVGNNEPHIYWKSSEISNIRKYLKYKTIDMRREKELGHRIEN